MYIKGSLPTKFANIASTELTESATHVIKNEPGLLSHIVVNNVSGSTTDCLFEIWDGYMSSSFSASVALPEVLTGARVGTIHPVGANLGEEFEYDLVINTGLVVVAHPTGSIDFTILFE